MDEASPDLCPGSFFQAEKRISKNDRIFPLILQVPNRICKRYHFGNTKKGDCYGHINQSRAA